MTDPSKYVFEPVWEDGEFTLSRKVRDGERSPLLAVAPALARPAPGTVTQLEHAYALRDELDPAWAVRPLALEHQHGRPTLLSPGRKRSRNEPCASSRCSNSARLRC